MLVDFELFIFLVRNLRGMYAPMIRDGHERYVSWIVKRYKYRDIGVADCIVKSRSEVFKGRLEGKPFHVLRPLTRSLAEAIEIFSSSLAENTGERCLLKSMALSLVYAIPLYLTKNSLDTLQKKGMIVHVVKGFVKDLNQAKLHMRIAGYSVLDYLVNSVRAATECIRSKECKPDNIVSLRREFAERDEKRYWRIMNKGDNIVIAYIDHVHKLLRMGIAENFVSSEARVLLGMPIGILLDSMPGIHTD